MHQGLGPHVLVVDDSPEKLQRSYGHYVPSAPFEGNPADEELRKLERGRAGKPLLIQGRNEAVQFALALQRQLRVLKEVRVRQFRRNRKV